MATIKNRTTTQTKASGDRIKQKYAAFIFGLVFVVAILVLAVALPTPTQFQYTIFRIVIALAAAGVAAMIPGFLEVEISNWVRAGGALAVFVLVYFYNPATLIVNENKKEETTALRQSGDQSRLIFTLV